MLYTKHFNTKATPQSEPIPGSQQEKNSAGGYSFVVDDWTRLDRFLILGCPGGSYYASEQKLTRENAECVIRCMQADGKRTVDRIVEVSQLGRAPKNAPAVFALALCSALGDPATRQYALGRLDSVARIGTDLFAFVQSCQDLRGWGRGLREGVANWYTSKKPDQLAYQVSKYQQRDGFSHRDVLRLCHARTTDPAMQAVLRWVTHGADHQGQLEIKRKTRNGERMARYAAIDTTLPDSIQGLEEARKATDAHQIVRLIERYRLVREMIPTQFLNSKEVWEALLENMPMGAMVRNLGKMTAVGLVTPLSAASKKICQALGDVQAIKKARLHPLNLLVAANVYQQGHGDKGSLSWQPDSMINNALDRAFHLAFEAVEPTHKNWLLALDVSGSMSCGQIAGMPGINPRIGSAAMALVTASVEPNHHIVGFSTRLVNIPISPRDTLHSAIAAVSRIPMGGTDCAQPMIYASERKIPVDAFVVYTDSETWAGHIHPVQALKEYRQKMGRPAKLIVCGMVSNRFSIADPNDAGMLDVVGFSTDVPQVMSDFVR